MRYLETHNWDYVKKKSQIKEWRKIKQNVNRYYAWSSMTHNFYFLLLPEFSLLFFYNKHVLRLI